MSKVDSDKALASVLADIEKQFGKGAIMKLGEQEKIETAEILSPGSLEMNGDVSKGRGVSNGNMLESLGTGLPRGGPSMSQRINVQRSKQAFLAIAE